MNYLKHIFSYTLLLQLAVSGLYAQTIQGTVADRETGEPLPFTTIVNLKSNAGTVTDIHGHFELTAQEGSDLLKISMVGYDDVNVLASPNLDIRLETSTISLSEIVVSTNREQEQRTEAPVAISSITSSTIEDNKPTRIDQVLNQTPGVNMVDLGNEQHTMSIRRPIDYGASYLYLEDGIPIRTSGVFNHNALLEINMANTSKIEIIRGPASSMYGSEAIGGAVNFISKRPSIRPTIGLSLQGSDLGYKRADFYASNTFSEKVGVRVAGYYANQKNSTLDYSDFDKLALSWSANYYVNDRTELVWSNALVDYDSDMSGSLDSADFYSKSYGSNQTFTYRKVNAYRTKLAVNQYWSDVSKTTVTAYFRSNSIRQNPAYGVSDDYIPWLGTGEPNLAHGQINDNSFHSYGMIAQHKQDFPWMKSSLIVGGSLDYSPNTYEAAYISIFKDDEGTYQSYTPTDSLLADYQANLLNVAGYVQVKLEPFKHFRVIGALRFDDFNYRFDNHLGSNAYTSVLDGKNTFTRVTPKLGITYELNRNGGVYANFSQGYVPPQVSTLYVGSSIPTLKPVYYDSYEAGGWFALVPKRATLEVSIYRMNGSNEIISVLKDDGTTVQKNAGETRHQGVEYGINFTPISDLKLRLSGTNAIHQFTDYDESGVDYSDKDMPLAPKWIANAQATYKPSYLKGVRVSLEWQHIGEYYMDQLNTKTYEGYDVFNLRLGYKWRSFEVWSNVMNVTDKLYATVARSTAWSDSYSLGNPRNFTLGLAYHFQQKQK